MTAEEQAEFGRPELAGPTAFTHASAETGRPVWRSAAHSLASWLGLKTVDELAELTQRGGLVDAIEERGRFHKARRRTAGRLAEEHRLAGVAPFMSAEAARRAMALREEA